MIERVVIRHFKRFEQELFELDDALVLAGPNNSGKSTLLQALMLWRFGIDRWIQQRKDSNATDRTGVPITRQQLTTLPLREMNLLWTGRTVAAGRKGSAGRKIEIIVSGLTEGEQWEYGIELQYQSVEMVYVRPVEGKSGERATKLAESLTVVHVPPFSGIQREEPRHDRGYQDMLVGAGRPGEVLRNLLLEVSETEEWDELCHHIKDLFSIELQRPQYSPGQPFIVCEYIPEGAGKPLDVASAGSGQLQVLLVLAFLYSRPASVVLIDEPDAHLHVVLQAEVYSLLKTVALRRGSQLLVATHSEVVLDNTDPGRVLALIGNRPRRLARKHERDSLREAMKRLATRDLLLAADRGAVLYTEALSDLRILQAWAEVLNHSARDAFLRSPYCHPLDGRNPREARDHFFALKAAVEPVRGLCILDRDRTEGADEGQVGDLHIAVWERYEIENYLLVPTAIQRYWEATNVQLSLFDGSERLQPPTKVLQDEMPQAAIREPLGDNPLLRDTKGSEFLLDVLRRCGDTTSKADLYMLAAVMTPDEIHPDVIGKLDLIAEVLAKPRDTEAS